MSHSEINERAGKLFLELPSEEAERRIATLHQLAALGLDAQAIDHLLMAVPLRARMVSRG
jgi:hypothetical protein